MSEIEQANGIEIPAEVIEVAEAAYAERLRRQTVDEKRVAMPAAIQAALDALEATVERNDTSRWWKPDVVKYRIVTSWREVP